jgi:hypothetical protein
VVAATQIVWTRFDDDGAGPAALTKDVLAVEEAINTHGILFENRQAAMPSGVGTPGKMI